jgi:hypothetical protein
MWQGIGEWLQLYRPGGSHPEHETWLGWDGWVSPAGSLPGQAIPREASDEQK